MPATSCPATYPEAPTAPWSARSGDPRMATGYATRRAGVQNVRDAGSRVASLTLEHATRRKRVQNVRDAGSRVASLTLGYATRRKSVQNVRGVGTGVTSRRDTREREQGPVRDARWRRSAPRRALPSRARPETARIAPIRPGRDERSRGGAAGVVVRRRDRDQPIRITRMRFDPRPGTRPPSVHKQLSRPAYPQPPRRSA
jgi:hypothetical protein